MEYIEEKAHPDIKFGLHEHKVHFESMPIALIGMCLRMITARHYTPHLTNL